MVAQDPYHRKLSHGRFLMKFALEKDLIKLVQLGLETLEKRESETRYQRNERVALIREMIERKAPENHLEKLEKNRREVAIKNSERVFIYKRASSAMAAFYEEREGKKKKRLS